MFDNKTKKFGKQKELLACFIAFLIILASVSPSLAVDPPRNKASAYLQHRSIYMTNADFIDNVPISMSREWFATIGNTPDGLGPLTNPKIEVKTDIDSILHWYPSDPAIFTSNKPYYTWNFAGLVVEEEAAVPIGMDESPIVVRPKFSAMRTVEPEVLVEQTTIQTVTFTFKLEEPIAPAINMLSIAIGTPIIAYQGKSLIDGYFVSQNDVQGWVSESRTTQASWRAFASDIEIGKTYSFQADLKSIKSPELLGAPIFKPSIQISYERLTPGQTSTGNSAVISMPDGSVSATFSVDQDVDWSTGYRNLAFVFVISPKVSQVTTEPPFRVIVPANIRIEPQTLSLSSNGLLTVFVDLPSPYNVRSIDVSTVKCQGAIVVKDNVASDTFILKFDRQTLIGLSLGENIPVSVQGQLNDGSMFSGQTTLNIIK